MSHTPGPWTNHGRIAQRGIPHSLVGARTLIARVYSESYGDVEEEIANANLIAAAPLLLSALQQIRTAPVIEEHFDLRMLIDDVIAKATGASA